MPPTPPDSLRLGPRLRASSPLPRSVALHARPPHELSPAVLRRSGEAPTRGRAPAQHCRRGAAPCLSVDRPPSWMEKLTSKWRVWSCSVGSRRLRSRAPSLPRKRPPSQLPSGPNYHVAATSARPHQNRPMVKYERF